MSRTALDCEVWTGIEAMRHVANKLDDILIQPILDGTCGMSMTRTLHIDTLGAFDFFLRDVSNHLEKHFGEWLINAHFADWPRRFRLTCDPALELENNKVPADEPSESFQQLVRGRRSPS